MEGCVHFSAREEFTVDTKYKIILCRDCLKKFNHLECRDCKNIIFTNDYYNMLMFLHIDTKIAFYCIDCVYSKKVFPIFPKFSKLKHRNLNWAEKYLSPLISEPEHGFLFKFNKNSKFHMFVLETFCSRQSEKFCHIKINKTKRITLIYSDILDLYTWPEIEELFVYMFQIFKYISPRPPKQIQLLIMKYVLNNRESWPELR